MTASPSSPRARPCMPAGCAARAAAATSAGCRRKQRTTSAKSLRGLAGPPRRSPSANRSTIPANREENAMANDLTITNGDGWDAVPETGGMLRGQMIKFKDGRHLVDKINDITGNTLVAVDVTTAWVKWQDGEKGD